MILKLKYSEKELLDNYILNFNVNTLNGKIIIKELVEKVFSSKKIITFI